MNKENDYIYKSKKKIKLISYLFPIIIFTIFNIIIIYFNGADFLLLEIDLLLIPFLIMIILVFYFLDPIIILYKDRIEGKFIRNDIKTKKVNRINKINFDDINRIYFSKKRLDNNIYIEYQDKCHITLSTSDKLLSLKFEETLMKNFMNRIIKSKPDDETHLNLSLKYVLSIIWLTAVFGISMIVILGDNMNHFIFQTFIIIAIITHVALILSLEYTINKKITMKNKFPPVIVK